MTRLLLLLLSICLCGTLAACSGYQTTQENASLEAQSAQAAAPAPLPPQGTALGASYTSALKENCYELIALSGQMESARAMCLRDGDWVILSPIFSSLPVRQ